MPAYREPLERDLLRMRPAGSTLVALHLRRGDFTTGAHWVAPATWYVSWLEANWHRWPDPVLYLASDDLDGVAGHFAAFAPRSARDLSSTVPAATYYPDFFVLSQADVLATSDSSFSLVAAMLNERAGEFLRPHATLQRLVPFEPWNTDFWHRSDEDTTPVRASGWFHAHASRIAAALKEPVGQPDARAARLGQLRRELADQVMTMDEMTLTSAFFLGLAEAHAAASASLVRAAAPRTSGDAQLVADAVVALGRRGHDWWLQCLLTVMLFCAPDELQIDHDFDDLPLWFVPAYLDWLRSV